MEGCIASKPNTEPQVLCRLNRLGEEIDKCLGMIFELEKKLASVSRPRAEGQKCEEKKEPSPVPLVAELDQFIRKAVMAQTAIGGIFSNLEI